MSTLALMMGATKLVEVCADVRPGERVVVVTDYATSLVGEVVAQAALARHADVVVVTMKPRQLDGEEPPAAVAQALLEAEVIFTPVQKSITHTVAMRQALGRGARAIMMSAFRPEMLMSGGIDADFQALRPLAVEVGAAFGKAHRARLTTPAGTDLTVDISGRPGNAHGGVVRQPGEMATVPNVEASVSPVEGSAEGVIVIDASIPYFDLGVVQRPIRMEVAHGRIAHIGGDDPIVPTLTRMLEAIDRPEVYNVAQVALGLNPHCRIKGWMLEDEGVYGTAHVGIGTSANLGGEVRAPLHFDALMWYPSLFLDEREVMRDGKWLHA